MDAATLNVGKNGVTDEFIAEARAQLKKRKKLKIRFLRSARESADRKAIAAEIASRIPGSKVADARGNTLTLVVN